MFQPKATFSNIESNNYNNMLVTSRRGSADNIVMMDIDKEKDIYNVDACHDYHGKRLATCSSDFTVRVYSRRGGNEWVEDCALPNAGARVDWAHPEFGVIIATCSIDTVTIWEEAEQASASASAIAESIEGTKRQWQVAAKIGLMKGTNSFSAIKFSPHHLGLQLAVSSDDGYVRIYRASDPICISAWNLEYEFEVQHQSLSSTATAGHSTGGVTSISWNPFHLDKVSMLVVGTTNGNVMVWKLDAKKRKWLKMVDLTEREEKTKMLKDDAMSKKSNHGEESVIINEVSWAPNMGRSFHLIASAASNGMIKIWKMTLSNADDGASIESIQTETVKHGSEAYKVEWNVTGTVLATSGDDDQVLLWKSDYNPSLFEGSSSSTATAASIDKSTWKVFEMHQRKPY